MEDGETSDAPLFSAVLLNDDDHSYFYVVEMLVRLFFISPAQALRHALERPHAVFGRYANGESPGYVLLLWNKIELPHVLPAREILSHPTVALLRQHGCRFEMARCSVMTGDGVHSAFRTLAELDGEL